MSDLRKTLLGLPHKRTLASSSGLSRQNFSPLKWQDYFDKEEYIETASGKHHIYIKGCKGPIIFCLHGGGYNGLTWSLFAKEMFANIECQIVALDFRGHGNTKTNHDNDLSLETLAGDVVEVANTIGQAEQSTIVLIGHSMGGAIAVSASYKIRNLVGLCVIDVVEGTALDALSSMQSILRGRPSHFKSIPHAIQWCYKGGQCHNLEAARVSMPGQIVNIQTGTMACDEWSRFETMIGTDIPHSAENPLRSAEFTITEGVEELGGNDACSRPPLQEETCFKTPNVSGEGDDGPHYTWRIDLSKTELYWKHWFQGLSERFLGSNVPKILMLANISGLDTKLTVGQMQGKFQLQVLAKTGHAVHEDQPHQVAEILSIYLVKQKCAVTKSGFVMPLYPNVCC